MYQWRSSAHQSSSICVMLGYILCMFVCVCECFRTQFNGRNHRDHKTVDFSGEIPKRPGCRSKRNLEHRKIAEIDDKIISVICWRHQTNSTLLCSLAFDRVLVCVQPNYFHAWLLPKEAHKLFLQRKCGIFVGSADAADVPMALALEHGYGRRMRVAWIWLDFETIWLKGHTYCRYLELYGCLFWSH